ncbi:peptidase M23 [Nocardia terpenica]|uniref:CIS tube protein n=1 Tax=Nocardia terpenica TaxID=455432 RepID=UPI00142E501E|nr:peptidase M23 [Nocardia terpenica]
MSAVPLTGALARAALVIYEPPAGPGQAPGPVRARIRLQFNPSSLALGKRASWARTPARTAPRTAGAEYTGAEPRAMSLEVFLDAGHGHVQEQVETLLSCCAPTDASVAARRPSAPWVQLEWGTSRTTAFPALVTSVEAIYTLFSPTGTPMRATCTVYLEEAGGAVPRQNPTSGGQGALAAHRMVQGETLAHIAWRAYRDASLWRAVARASDVTDPFVMPAGTTVVIPAVEDTGGAR